MRCRQAHGADLVRLTIGLSNGGIVEGACLRRELARTTRRLMTIGYYARTSDDDGRATESLTRVERVEW
jgi:hypothetical protein